MKLQSTKKGQTGLESAKVERVRSADSFHSDDSFKNLESVEKQEDA